MELCDKTLIELTTKIENGIITCKDIMISILNRIDLMEKELNAYITIRNHDTLIKEAENCDKIRNTEKSFPKFLGLPIAVKDIICTKGIKTTCASKILHNFIPPYDATIVKKLKEHGFIIFGKTNCDEFAMGSTNENSFFGTVKNPWDLERVSGGSSGGSAASVASGESIIALGTDTGGSIRFPSSLCGVVGIKPTYGRVSRYGITAYASSFDQAGIISKSVEDAAKLLEIISGKDSYDSTSADIPVDNYMDLLYKKDIKELKIGLPKEYYTDGITPEVKTAIDASLKELENLGAKIIDISLPHTEYAIATYYIIVTAEASSNMARYDGVNLGYRTKNCKNIMDMFCNTRSEGFGFEVKKRIMLGTYVLMSGYYDQYYNKALKVRNLIRRDFENAFKQVDVIVTPVSPSVAPKIGDVFQDPLQLYLNDIFTSSVNLAGLPAITTCCGFSKNRLPIGIQFIGNYFDEKTILNIAYSYEQSTNWSKVKPIYTKTRSSG